MNYFDRIRGESGKALKAAGRTRPPIVRDVVPPAIARPEAPPEPTRPRPAAPVLVKPPPARRVPPRSREERTPPPTPPPIAPTPAAPPELIIESELPIRTWEPTATKRARLRRRLMAGAFLLGALAAFGLPTFFFSRFSITIYPRTETVAVERIELIADSSLSATDPPSRKIPSLLLAVDRTAARDYDATGTAFVQERARGTIRVFNAFSSAPQTLVASTRFQDSTGKVFRLTAPLVIPGAEVAEGKIVPTSVAADVAADAPGEAYNIGPTEFRIPGFRGTPKYQGFYARSDQGLSGGFEGQARIVTAEDVKRASEDLTRRIFDEVRGELEAKVPGGLDFWAPAGAREITITTIELPRGGERGDRFSGTVTARGRMVVIRRSHVMETLSSLLVPNDSKLPARTPLAQTGLTIEGARWEGSGSRIRMPVAGTLTYFRETNVAELIQILRTSTPKKAETYLAGQNEIESFRLQRFPPWLWFIPRGEGDLSVSIEAPG